MCITTQLSPWPPCGLYRSGGGALSPMTYPVYLYSPILVPLPYSSSSPGYQIDMHDTIKELHGLSVAAQLALSHYSAAISDVRKTNPTVAKNKQTFDSRQQFYLSWLESVGLGPVSNFHGLPISTKNYIMACYLMHLCMGHTLFCANNTSLYFILSYNTFPILPDTDHPTSYSSFSHHRSLFCGPLHFV